MAILVIGATGAVGRAAVARLLREGEEVRGATRDPGAAAGRLPAGAAAVRFDLERPETFAPALRGATALLVIARPGDDRPEFAAAPLLEEAARAGVRRVVTLSAMGAELDPAFGLRRVELIVERSGLEFTHLRPNFFHQMLAAAPLGPAIRASGEIALPTADARISWVDARDVGEAAAVALAGGEHAGRAYVLTGPESLHHAEVAAVLGDASGRRIVYRPIEESEARERILAGGLSAQRADRLLGFYRRVRAGQCAPVSDAVPALLGRPSRGLGAFAREASDAWR